MLGLQGAGKTTLVNVIAVRSKHTRSLTPVPRATIAHTSRAICVAACLAPSQVGEFTEDTIPTVGFNMRKVNKGNVTIKFWDLGGQPRFRGMWERYCRGVSAIV